MSLFNKTVVIAGFTKRDSETLEKLFDAVVERLRGHDAQIAALNAEIEALKRQPRTSLKQRIRGQG